MEYVTHCAMPIVESLILNLLVQNQAVVRTIRQQKPCFGVERAPGSPHQLRPEGQLPQADADQVQGGHYDLQR